MPHVKVFKAGEIWNLPVIPLKVQGFPDDTVFSIVDDLPDGFFACNKATMKRLKRMLGKESSPPRLSKPKSRYQLLKRAHDEIRT